jgi:hypothetical protein
MERTNGPLDRKSAADLVARAVQDIDASGDSERDALLTDLLYAVWGSIWAQNQ